MTHKFAIGDRVRFVPGKYDGNVPSGVYTISRRLPIESNICQYRVKHALDGHERVVLESQLMQSSGLN